MSKGDREGFIVKFVEGKGQKTEYAVKAYEVSSVIWLKSIIEDTFFCHCSAVFLYAVDDNVCVVFTQAILELQSEKYLKTIDEEAVLQMDHNDKSLFVFSSFTTPAFLHCKKV